MKRKQKGKVGKSINLKLCLLKQNSLSKDQISCMELKGESCLSCLLVNCNFIYFACVLLFSFRDQELAKVVLNKADVELIVSMLLIFYIALL